MDGQPENMPPAHSGGVGMKISQVEKDCKPVCAKRCLFTTYENFVHSFNISVHAIMYTVHLLIMLEYKYV